MIKKILNVFLGIVLCFFVAIGILVIFSVFPFFKGYNIFTVQSGSMEPTIKTGSLIFTKEQSDYEVGDIITRETKDRKMTVTHRIVRKEGEKKITFYTKGDANEAEDTTSVTEDKIVGKAWLAIPFVGYVISFARTTPGLIVLIVVPAVIIIYEEVQKIQREVRKKIDYKKRLKKRLAQSNSDEVAPEKQDSTGEKK